MNNRFRLRVSLAVLAAGQFFALGAQAQDAETSGDDAIIVTAQRREENLQDVSVAVTAVSGESLAAKGIDRLDGLQFVSPGLTVTDAGLAQQVNIRGIGIATINPAIANGVATYVDGVFQPPIVTTNSFYDVDSVEVFRGPQGTFVGSNSTGGAIFINSRDPDLGEVNGYFEGSVGNYDYRGMEGAFNLPIGNTLAVRVAGTYQNRNSFYDDIGPLNNQPGRLDEFGVRIGALWEPSDSFSALLKADWAEKESGGYAVRPILGTAYEDYRTNDIRILDYDSIAQNNEFAFQTTLEMNYEFDSGLVLRSLSGYQNKRFYNRYDNDGTNAARYSAADAAVLTQQATNLDAREKIITQEINIISPSEERFDYVVGGYFQRNLIDVPVGILSAPPVNVFTHNRKTTLGVFAQFTYDLLDTLSIDVGARYSSYDVRQEGAVTVGIGFPGFPPGGVVVADLTGEHSDARMTGKVALNWSPDTDNLIYAFVARGYKAGGFASAVREFDPETVMDYEIGWKSTMLNGDLQTQIGAFYYDYNNFQFGSLEPATGQVNPDNITGAKIMGLEAQLQYHVGGLRLDAGLALNDSKLGDATFIDVRGIGLAFPGAPQVPQCPTGQPTTLPTCIDYVPFTIQTGGGKNLYSPGLTFNLGASYEFALGDVTITPSINYGYVGSQYTYLAYDPLRDRIASRGLVNAQIGFNFDRYSIVAFATNLTDEEYVSGQETATEYYGAPRQYGVRARVEF